MLCVSIESVWSADSHMLCVCVCVCGVQVDEEEPETTSDQIMEMLKSVTETFNDKNEVYLKMERKYEDARKVSAGLEAGVDWGRAACSAGDGIWWPCMLIAHCCEIV